MIVLNHSWSFYVHTTDIRSLLTSTILVQSTSPLNVVLKSDPVSSLRMNQNVAALETVHNNNIVPLVVPKNNQVSFQVSSPRVHQAVVTPLEVMQHNKMVRLTAPNNYPVFFPRVHQKVTPLETVQHNNKVLKSGVKSSKYSPPTPKGHTPIDPYTRVKKIFPYPLQKRHTYFTRSSTRKFVAQNVVNPEPTHHFAKHVFNTETGNNLSIEKLVKGLDSDK